MASAIPRDDNRGVPMMTTGDGQQQQQQRPSTASDVLASAAPRKPAALGPASRPSSSQLPRNRPGILSRQASEHERDDADSVGYMPSASEDDEVARYSDSSPLPQRFPPLTATAAASASPSAPRSVSSASNRSSIASASSSPLPGMPPLAPPSASFPSARASANAAAAATTAAAASVLQRDGSKRGVVPSPLSPAGSHLGSASSQSASSSRSHLPLQSKTSLYRRQASAGSGGDASEDGALSLGGASLDRAKSVSSVSSVTSTSSMEAVPFRAAPLGNVRTGFGGYVRGGGGGGGGGGGNASGSSSAPRSAGAPQRRHPGPAWAGEAVELDDTPRSAGLPNDDTMALDLEPRHAHSVSATTAKARLLPKGPSDDWHYRNAPGMGINRSGQRPLPPPGSFNTIAVTRSAGAADQLRRIYGADEDLDQAEGGVGGGSSGAKKKPGIRTKLAKRAGKLGLKPLTNVHVQAASALASSSSSSSSAMPRSSSPAPRLLEEERRSVDSSIVASPTSATMAAARSDAFMSSSAAASSSNVPLLQASRLSPETSFRAAKSYFGDNDPSMAMMRTSSVTNAPLIVPKHPPGPPGTGPPPSPGIMGAPTSPNNIYGFHSASSPAPKVSPTSEEGATVEFPSGGSHSPSSPPVRPQARRPNSFGSLTNLFGAVRIAQTSGSTQHTPLRSPSPLAASPVPPFLSQDGEPLASSPSITPAQQVRLEAEAGLARPPAEPSGPNPGSSPTPNSLHSSSIDEGLLIPGRPHSTSISSTLVTAKPRSAATTGHRYSSSAVSPAELPTPSSPSAGGAKRPGLFRAMTSESIMSKRRSQGSGAGAAAGDEESSSKNAAARQHGSGSPSRSRSRDLQVDENTGVSAYWSGRPMRSGSTSSPGSPSSPAAGQLRLEIPTSIPPYSGGSGEATPMFALSPRRRSPSDAKSPGSKSPERSPSSPAEMNTATPSREGLSFAGAGETGRASNPMKGADASNAHATEMPSVAVSDADADAEAKEGKDQQQQRNKNANDRLSFNPNNRDSRAPGETIHEEVSEEERHQRSGMAAAKGGVEGPQQGSKAPSIAVSKGEESDASLPSQAISLASDPDAQAKAPVKHPFIMPSLAASSVAAAVPGMPNSRLSPVPSITAGQTPTKVSGEPAPAPKAARSTRVRSDFEFGDILGEGSYSTVIQAWDLLSIDQSRPASAGSGGVHTPSSSTSNGPSVAPTALAKGANQRNTALAAMVGKTSKADLRRAQRQGAKVYAVKILDKVHILKEKKQKYVNVEKEALSLLIRHPGVITLYWTFQDSNSLYFVLELAPNGELLSFIKKLGSFDKACSRYYAAQLLDTIEGIHAAGIVHRDIKPENVLLDGEMRVKVTDFGSAKIKKKAPNKPATATPATNEEQERASSFVGTAEYVSPELLTDKSVTERSDLWAFGCVVYQIIGGRPPFKGVSEYQTFQKIIKGDYEFVDAFPEDAKDLVQGLLQLDAAKRFSIDEMKGHKFFEGVNWKGIWKEPAPELKVGIYARPQPVRSAGASQSSDFEGIAWGGVDGDEDEEEDEEDEEEEGEEGDDDDDEDDDDAVTTESGNPSSRVSQNSNDLAEVRRQAQDDADDDDSSISDSGPSPRRRGFSTGSAMAERMLGAKRSSNIMRIAAGITGSSSGSSSNNNNNNNDGGRAPRGPIHRSSFGPTASGSSGGRLLQQVPLSQHLSIGSASTSSGAGNDATVRASKSSRTPLFTTSTAAPDDRTFASSAADMSWAALLLPHEALLYAAPILHRQAGAFRTNSKKRQLLLTDFPRLLCVKETNDQLKVKSEVILAVPAFLSASIPFSGPNSASMRRQSSAGPSFAFAADSPQTGPSSNNSQDDVVANNLAAVVAASNTSTTATGRLLRRDSLPSAISSSIRRRDSSSSPAAAAPDSSLPSTSTTTPMKASNAAADLLPNFLSGLDQKGARTFIVQTPARSYVYEDPSGDANQWIRSITNAVQRAQGSSLPGQ